MKRFLIAVLIVVLLAGSAYAAKYGRGTATEAFAMVERAVAYIKTNGQEAAFKEFSNLKGQFIDRDLYVWVVDMNGKVLAHGGFPALVGQDLIDLRDVDGKAFLRDAIALAKAKNSGWFDYKWANPMTREIEQKSTYFQKADGFIVCCGIYYPMDAFGI